MRPSPGPQDGTLEQIENDDGHKGIRMYFKKQFELKSTAGLEARILQFKTIKDVRDAIIVKAYNSQTQQYDQEITGYFTSDPEFLKEIVIRPLRGWDKFKRCAYRFLSINDALPTAYSNLVNNFSNPATIAIITTILHAKDEVAVQSTTPTDWGKFFGNLGWSLGLVLLIITILQLIELTEYYAYRFWYPHIDVLRITRFQGLQDTFDRINPHGNNWNWAYNYKQNDPDLSMIYYNFCTERKDAEKNICLCGGRKLPRDIPARLKEKLLNAKVGLGRLKRDKQVSSDAI